MANHVRQQIREAAATLLTGLTTTGARVFQSRVKVLADNELPCLVVLTNNETVENISSDADPIYERSLDLQVIAKAKQTDNLDDKLDTIMKEVETAIHASVSANTLSNLCKGISLSSIEVELNGEGEKPVGQATMTFNVTYYTRAAAPDVSI